MTKQEYELVASVLHEQLSVAIGSYKTDGESTVWDVVLSMADAFESRNPRFKRDTFINACTVPYSEIR